MTPLYLTCTQLHHQPQMVAGFIPLIEGHHILMFDIVGQSYLRNSQDELSWKLIAKLSWVQRDNFVKHAVDSYMVGDFRPFRLVTADDGYEFDAAFPPSFIHHWLAACSYLLIQHEILHLICSAMEEWRYIWYFCQQHTYTMCCNWIILALKLILKVM